MDAAKKARVVNRNRPTDTAQSQRGDRQIVVPMTQEQFDACWHDAEAMAADDHLTAAHGEFAAEARQVDPNTRPRR